MHFRFPVESIDHYKLQPIKILSHSLLLYLSLLKSSSFLLATASTFFSLAAILTEILGKPTLKSPFTNIMVRHPMTTRGGAGRGGPRRGASQSAGSGHGQPLSLRNYSRTGSSPTPPLLTESSRAEDVPESSNARSTSCGLEGIHTDSDSSHRGRGRGSHSLPDVPTNPSMKPLVTFASHDTFADPKVVRGLTKILKSMFGGSWSSFKNIDNESRERLWQRFQLYYRWNPEDDGTARVAWETTLTRRLYDMLGDARLYGRRAAINIGGVDPNDVLTNYDLIRPYGPEWMNTEHWNSLCSFWNTSEWQARSKQAKKNRATEFEGSVSKHTGGFISFPQHRLRMKHELRREATQHELFLHTHTKKKKTRDGSTSVDGEPEFIDPRSRVVFENHTREYARDHEEADPATQPIGDFELWSKACGGVKKGRVYGCGLSADPHYGSISSPMRFFIRGSNIEART